MEDAGILSSSDTWFRVIDSTVFDGATETAGGISS